MNKKLTIIHPMDPQGLKNGGVETFIKGLLKYIPEDINLSIVGLGSNKNAYKLNEWQNIVVNKRKIPFYPVMKEQREDKKTRIPLAFRFTWALKKAKLDLTGHDLFFHRLEPAILFLNNKNKKFFVFHSDIEKHLSPKESEVFWAKIPQIYRWLEKKIYSYATKVLTVSTVSYNYYQKVYPNWQNKFAQIPTWVDTEIFYPSKTDKQELKQVVAEKYKLPAEQKWGLFVGRLQTVKNPFKLVEIAMHTTESLAIIVVGDGNLKNELIEYIKINGMQKRVLLLGSMQQQDIRELYQTSDLFLLTSHFEGMPLCIMEAMACGIPSVATPVGEVKKVIQSGISGEVADSFETFDMVSAVDKVIRRRNTLYTIDNCIKCVSPYTAQGVIKKMYDKLYS